MQIALKLNPSCDVQPEKTKAFRETPTQIGTPAGVQHDRPACIGVSGNYRASSERFPSESPILSGMASSLATSMRKSTRKSVQNRSQQRSRGTPNRCKIGPGSPSGHPVVPKSVPEVYWERLGSGSERPRCAPGAPGGSRRAPRDAKKDAREHPGARRGD